MMNKIVFSLLSLCGLLLLAGCGGPAVNPAEPARPRAEYDIIPDKRVEMDRSLARRLELQYINETEQGDLRRVQTVLRNTSRQPIHFQYRFDWIDENGMAVPTPTTTWIPRIVDAGETIMLASIAPHPRTEDFRFLVRTLPVSR